MQSKAAQRAYTALIEEIVSRVLNHEFTRPTELAKAYSRSQSFGSKIKRAAINRGLISAETWKLGFTHPGKREQTWRCPSCGHRWSNKSTLPKLQTI